MSEWVVDRWKDRLLMGERVGCVDGFTIFMNGDL